MKVIIVTLLSLFVFLASATASEETSTAGIDLAEEDFEAAGAGEVEVEDYVVDEKDNTPRFLLSKNEKACLNSGKVLE